jgi:hypothetical protein
MRWLVRAVHKYNLWFVTKKTHLTNNDQYLLKNSHAVPVTNVFDRTRMFSPDSRSNAHAVQTNCILWSKRHY